MKGVTTAGCFAVLLLAGCGGGGGGGGGIVPTGESTFANFTNATFADAPHQPFAVAADGTLAAAAPGDVDISIQRDATRLNSVTVTVTGVGGRSFQQTFNSLSAGSEPVPGGTVTFYGQTVGTVGGDRSVLVFDFTTLPAGARLSYVTLGYWDDAVSGGTTVGSFVPIGFATAAGSMPTSGGATYSGAAVGLYADGVSAVPAGYGATVSAITDFANRSISFQATDAFIIPDGGVQTTRTDLNLNGTLTYAAGSNSFSGPVTASGAGLNGAASGRFYGPTAQEMGGSFALTDGTEGLAGGFVARQP